MEDVILERFEDYGCDGERDVADDEHDGQACYKTRSSSTKRVQQYRSKQEC